MEKIAEVYAIARRRERRSIEFYRQAAAEVEGEAEKKLLSELADMEEAHFQQMQSWYDEAVAKLRKLRER
ncbi:hypothetical protein DESUT3_17910 [Desulfuromonas versatilis]|uniref:Rubrerythrin diiron-binding domain-containing protein n=1 Tax=Desulfuromonas versatilis TaxID=2802975 RepID=A0ABM8HP68_9BACT|nr:hypothetical protein DESUT3_17910 [Desulfuromonas versatilis]